MNQVLERTYRLEQDMAVAKNNIQTIQRKSGRQTLPNPSVQHWAHQVKRSDRYIASSVSPNTLKTTVIDDLDELADLDF